MRHLVRHNVLEHRLGGENQSPAEREVSLSRAAAPSAPRIADTDPGHFAPDARRQSMRATRDFGLCPCNQMSTDPTRQTQRIRWNTPSTGTTAPSTKGTCCGKASRRASIHPRFAARKRRPVLGDTPRGRTSSTVCSAALIRSPTRRARGLTRIATGAPIAGSQCGLLGPRPICRCNNSPGFLELANDNRAPKECESVGGEVSLWLWICGARKWLRPARSRIGFPPDVPMGAAEAGGFLDDGWGWP